MTDFDASYVAHVHRRAVVRRDYDVADLVSGRRGAVVLESGDMEHGIWWAGISTGMIDDIPTCGELVSRIISGADEIINRRLPELCQSS